jgi:hypothetical protein
MAIWPRFGLAPSDVRDELPSVAGGLGVVLAESLKILHTKLRSPSTAHPDQAFRLLDLLQ